MEYIHLWEALTKSLARSLQAPISESASNTLFVISYLVIIVLANTRQLRLSFLCLIACLIVSNSVIYDVINNWQLHLLYSIVYLFAVPLADKLKTMLALFLMALFNGLMTWDAYNYATIKTWLYSNYEYITAYIHVVIICTGLSWRNIVTKLSDSINNLRDIITHTGCSLHCGMLLRYNKETENHQER